jgi:hypothetical protein
MGLFERLFSSDKDEKEEQVKQPVFGRYSDNNKSSFQLEEWNKSKKLYDQQEYDDSIVHFFTYLRDPNTNNVIFEKENDTTKFFIHQGSKKISGSIDDYCVKAEVAIASFTEPSVPVFRQLLEKNFQLYYSKFYLDEDKLKLKIYNNIRAAAPNKLYYALKELSIQADRLDDILVDDFKALEAAGTEHIVECSPEEKQVKYDFFRYWIDKTIAKIEKLNPDTFSGGISYMMLNLVFKLDYLLLPEGRFTEKLEEVNSIFWTNPKEIAVSERNYNMLKKLKELQQWKEEDVKKYFYKAKHTFSLTKPTPFNHVIDTINNTFKNVTWYRENDHNDIVLEMLEYSFAFSQFSYSLPKPATQLFDILMHVNHNDYYQAMGYEDRLYDRASKTFDADKVKEKIEAINAENQERYALMNIDTASLDFENLQSFNFTLLLQITKLDFRKKK